MPRQQATAIENNFIGGVNSEATALKFPTNACTEAFDCTFDETGRVTRRKGFDLETNYVNASVTIVADVNEVVTEFVWDSVSGDGTKTFAVVQHGKNLLFYDISNSSEVSPNKLTGTVDLSNHVASGSGLLPAQYPCQYAIGNGDLIVTNRACDPIYVSYDIVSAVVSGTSITLKERDIYGVDDGLAVDARFSGDVADCVTNNPEHYYNIINQGWHIGDALSQWDTARSDLPSNSDVVSMYRASTTDAFDDSIVTSKTGHNSPAARGHFILDVFDKDRAQALDDGGFNSIVVGTTPVAVGDGVGTVFGNSQTLGAYTNANAFDANTNTTGAIAPNATTALYVGKDYGVNPIKVSKVDVYGDTDALSGFVYTVHGGTAPYDIDNVTITLYASNSAPTGPTDGTSLGTTGSFNENTATMKTINSSDTTTTYRYVWVTVTEDSADSDCYSYVTYVKIYYAAPVTDDAGVSLDGETIVERPTTCAFFAGRAFYAGTNKDGLHDHIYFSQIVENANQYGLCYQKNDPTSEDYFDLLSDDGGVIRIPELGTVHKLFSARNTLFVMASNGVWMIRGSSGIGFAANDYVVQRLSNNGTNSPLSFVDLRGLPVWWGENNIFTITYNPQFDSYSVDSLTDTTFRTFITNIPPKNRKYVKGAYNKEENLVHWLYKDDSSLATADFYKYDHVLTYNPLSKAFYPWTIGEPSSGPEVRGIIYVSDAEDFDNPIIKYTATIPVNSTTAYVTFSDTTTSGYTDWATYAADLGSASDETDYTSYFVTGHRLDGEAQRFFQSPYIFVYLETESNSGCLMQPIFDFTNSDASGKWGTAQQIYNSSLTYRNINFRRLKVRGKGRALQLKFTSESGKPFNIVGWTIRETSNADL